jgi:hypothetical protein
MPASYASPPSSPGGNELGRISLSGESVITIPKEKLVSDPFVPFSPVLEIYLNGNFDIKRSPPAKAMTMNLGIILHTDLKKTF